MSKIVRRNLQDRLTRAAERFPTVTITGPRQSGKTTLCRSAFPDRPWANLEVPDIREFARSDPRGFLAQFPEGAILDEIQRLPDLLSYLQDDVDRQRSPGRWILTGSQNLALLEGVSQSLAGRTAVLHLLPLSLDEVRRFPEHPGSLWEVLWAGGYPRILDEGVPPDEWHSSYAATYVERDVWQVLRVGDLEAFQTFLGLCAGRAGRLLNLSALGADCGVSHNTARSWLSVLETGFLVFRLPPLMRNVRKRLTKSPKLYFYDSGLLCHLLGIREPGQLATHPLRGAVFESWVISEVLKARLHRGLTPGLHFYRDHRGEEVDLVVEEGRDLLAVEIKSGQTVAREFFAALGKFARVLDAAVDWSPRLAGGLLVYGGEQTQRRSDATALSWSEVADFDWTLREGA